MNLKSGPKIEDHLANKQVTIPFFSTQDLALALFIFHTLLLSEWLGALGKEIATYLTLQCFLIWLCDTGIS